MPDPVMDKWPPLLTPASITWKLRGAVTVGGRSLGGLEQRIANSSGYWSARLNQVHVYDPRDSYNFNRILLMRAMFTRMGGVLNPVLLGPFDQVRSPLTGGPQNYFSAFTDGSTFSDGTGFYESAFTPDAETATAGVLGATSVQVRVRNDEQVVLRPGHYIGILNRVYRIGSMTTLATNRYLVTIQPSLRLAHPDNTVVEVRNPVCPMRLVGSDEPDMDIDYNRHSVVDLEFEEMFF